MEWQPVSIDSAVFSVDGTTTYESQPALRFVMRDGQRILQYAREAYETDGDYTKLVTEWIDVPLVEE